METTIDNNPAEHNLGLAEKLEAASLHNGFFQSLLKQLDLTHEEFEALRDRVFVEFQDFIRSHPELESDVARRTFAYELIKASSRKSAIIGGLTSLPVTLPVVGTFLPFVMRLGILFSFSTRVQLELIFSLAALYDYPWKGKELSAIGFVLVGLSDYDDVKSYAAKMGVKLTVKKFVGKLAGLVTVELASHLLKGAHGPMMARIMGQSVVASSPWYLLPFKYGPGAALGAFFAYDSTKNVGHRALYFFSDEEEEV